MIGVHKPTCCHDSGSGAFADPSMALLAWRMNLERSRTLSPSSIVDASSSRRGSSGSSISSSSRAPRRLPSPSVCCARSPSPEEQPRARVKPSPCPVSPTRDQPRDSACDMQPKICMPQAGFATSPEFRNQPCTAPKEISRLPVGDCPNLTVLATAAGFPPKEVDTIEVLRPKQRPERPRKPDDAPEFRHLRDHCRGISFTAPRSTELECRAPCIDEPMTRQRPRSCPPRTLLQQSRCLPHVGIHASETSQRIPAAFPKSCGTISSLPRSGCALPQSLVLFGGCKSDENRVAERKELPNPQLAEKGGMIRGNDENLLPSPCRLSDSTSTWASIVCTPMSTSRMSPQQCQTAMQRQAMPGQAEVPFLFSPVSEPKGASRHEPKISPVVGQCLESQTLDNVVGACFNHLANSSSTWASITCSPASTARRSLQECGITLELPIDAVRIAGKVPNGNCSLESVNSDHLSSQPEVRVSHDHSRAEDSGGADCVRRQEMRESSGTWSSISGTPASSARDPQRMHRSVALAPQLSFISSGSVGSDGGVEPLDPVDACAEDSKLSIVAAREASWEFADASPRLPPPSENALCVEAPGRPAGEDSAVTESGSTWRWSHSSTPKSQRSSLGELPSVLLSLPRVA